MGSLEVELQQQLKEAGNKLLNPPSSVDELLRHLDKVEQLLATVEQAPSKSMQDALLPTMRALKSNSLLRHINMEVKVSVASCITEITRITAPDAPYNDEQMKEVFQLTVAAFENLSHVSGRCYTKAVSILDNVARVRSCLVMLDLECDELIIQMFQHFLKTIRSNHPQAVFLAMETIMILVLHESEDISLGLLNPLLDSVRKENQKVSPVSWKLGEIVIANCAQKIKPYLLQAVKSMGIALDQYSPVLASICRSESSTPNHHHVNPGDHLVLQSSVCSGEGFKAADGISKPVVSKGSAGTRNGDTVVNDNPSKSLEHYSHEEQSKSADASGSDGHDNVSVKAVKLETEQDTVPKKRGRRPNSLMNPEEGYDHSWVRMGRRTPKTALNKKPLEKGVDCLSSADIDSKRLSGSLTHEEVTDSPGDGQRRRGRPKKKHSMTDEDADPGSVSESKKEALNAHNLENAPQSEGRSESKIKQKKRSRKIRLAEKEREELTPGSVSEKELQNTGDLEEKPLQQSAMKVRRRNFKQGRSSSQTSIKKNSLGDDTTPDKIVGGTPDNKKMISELVTPASTESPLEDSPKASIKRKRTAGKNEESGLPDLGEELIGKRIKVWWPLDKKFYEGVVDSYDNVKKKHRVLYADGDEEKLNLRRQRWAFIEDHNSPHGGQETNLPRPGASPDKVSKQKDKTDSLSPKSGKRRKTSKRSGAQHSTSTLKTKRSAGKSSEDARFDKPIVDEAVDDASMRDDDSDGEDREKSNGKLETETEPTNLKQTTPETVMAPKDASAEDDESGPSTPSDIQEGKGKEISPSN
ncbi:hypothetical protein SLE2022_380840 [Rubroshorea leprosula]